MDTGFSTLLQQLGWNQSDILTLNTTQEGRWLSEQVRAADAQGLVNHRYLERDAWFSVCPQRLRDGAPGRGRADDAVGLLALWADVDVKADGAGMPDKESCWALIADLSDMLGAQPVVVDSGHGWHPYWVLSDPLRWEAGDEAGLREARELLDGWAKLVHQSAVKHGGRVDSVFELARVLRVPGTVNTKRAGEPKRTSVHSWRAPESLVSTATVRSVIEAYVVTEDDSRSTGSLDFSKLDAEKTDSARRWFVAKIEGQLSDLAACGDMAEGATDSRGRGWEKIAADVAHVLNRVALALDIDAGDLKGAFMDAAPRGGYIDDRWLGAKWEAQRRLAIDKGPYPLPDDFGQRESMASVEASLFGMPQPGAGGASSAPAQSAPATGSGKRGGVLKAGNQEFIHAWGTQAIGIGPLDFLFSYANGIVYVDPTYGIRPVNHNTLTGIVASVYDVQDSKGNGTLLPERNARILASNIDALKNLRPLKAITKTPIVREDGSILDSPGYDDATGYFYSPGEDVFPKVPESPTTQDMQTARQWIDYMLCDFAFVSEGDKANYVGALMTPLLRLAAPQPYKLVSIEARQPGSGKSFLGRAPINLHGGSEQAAMPTNEEEFSKTVASILRETAGGVVMFDNVSGVVRSTTLTSLLTQPTFSARLLGSSSMVTIPNDKLWVMTGNNTQIGGDVARRTVRVMIDPQVPNPELRTDFRIPDWENWVRKNRTTVIWALLTLIRSWVVSGKPAARRGGDSYGLWIGTLDAILANAGYAAFDSPETRAEISDTDDDELRDFLGEVRRVFGTDTWRVKDIRARLTIPGSAREGEEGSFSQEVIPDYIMSGSISGLNAKKMGNWIKRNIGRWSGGACIVKDETHTLNSSSYRIKVVNDGR